MKMMGHFLLPFRMSSERASPLSLRPARTAKGSEGEGGDVIHAGHRDELGLAMMLSLSLAPILHCLEEVQYRCETLKWCETLNKCETPHLTKFRTNKVISPEFRTDIGALVRTAHH